MIKINKMQLSRGSELLLCIEDLSLYPGVYIVTGENGVGKTSFVDALAGNCSYEGEIDYGGIKTTDISQINQKVKLFTKLTIKQNIELLLTKEQVVEVDGLASKINFSEVLKKNSKVSKLSGGEVQKLQLIIGLLRDSKVLTLDEFDNNLDSQSVRTVLEYIKKLNKQYIFIISHNPQLISGITNYVIKMENQKLIVDSISGDLNEVEDIEVSNKSRLEKLNIKWLQKYNRGSYAVTAVLLIIGLLIVTNTILNISLNFEQMSDVVTSPFADDVSIVTAPRYTQQYSKQGDESWLDVTEYGFTDEQLKDIEDLNYVQSVTPIQNMYISGNLMYAPYEGLYVGFSEEEAILDISNLDYDKLQVEVGDKLINPSTEYYLDFDTLQSPSEVYKTTPMTQTSFSNDNILYGEVPKDETNQVAIDIYLAGYLSQEYDTTMEELVGKSVDLKLNAYDENVNLVSSDETYEFEISAVYYSPKTSGIKYSYHKDSINAEIAACSDIQFDYALDSCKFSYASDPLEFDMSYLDGIYNNPISMYGNAMTLYIKADEGTEEELINDIHAVDPYVEVDNNYARENSSNAKGYYEYMHQLYMMLGLTIAAIVVIYVLLYRWIASNIKRRILPMLNYYNFDEKSVGKIYSVSKNKLLKLTIIVQFLFILGFLVRVSFTFSMIVVALIVTFIFIDILIAIILKILR